MGHLQDIQDAFVAIFPPPPVLGLGTIGGFKLQIEDRTVKGYDALYAQTQQVLMKAWQDPSLTQVFSGYQVKVPQVDVDIDREKPKFMGYR